MTRMGQAVLWAPPTLVVALAAAWGAGLRPLRVAAGAEGPSLGHPLGVDGLGRDFLAVVAEGAADFVLPAVGAAAGVVLWTSLLAWREASRTDLDAPPARPLPWLALGSAPRLLACLLVTLVTGSTSAAWTAAVVAVLHLPIVHDEVSARLHALRARQVLAGLQAHGLPVWRLVLRHLVAGWLAEPLRRHAVSVATQVAFVRIALVWLVGSSAVSTRLSSDWGSEMQRLSVHLPGPGWPNCRGAGDCADLIASGQALVLLLVCAVGLGGTLRAAAPTEDA